MHSHCMSYTEIATQWSAYLLSVCYKNYWLIEQEIDLWMKYDHACKTSNSANSATYYWINLYNMYKIDILDYNVQLDGLLLILYVKYHFHTLMKRRSSYVIIYLTIQNKRSAS